MNCNNYTFTHAHLIEFGPVNEVNFNDPAAHFSAEIALSDAEIEVTALGH